MNCREGHISLTIRRQNDYVNVYEEVEVSKITRVSSEYKNTDIPFHLKRLTSLYCMHLNHSCGQQIQPSHHTVTNGVPSCSQNIDALSVSYQVLGSVVLIFLKSVSVQILLRTSTIFKLSVRTPLVLRLSISNKLKSVKLRS